MMKEFIGNTNQIYQSNKSKNKIHSVISTGYNKDDTTYNRQFLIWSIVQEMRNLHTVLRNVCMLMLHLF